MKFLSLLTLASVVVSEANAITIPFFQQPIDTSLASSSLPAAPASSPESLELVEPTSHPSLQKRYKDVIINKQYAAEQKAKNGEVSSSEQPKAWIRTYSESLVEIVTPTVIAGVTFAAKPPTTTNGLEHWVSLNKDGSPKTIKPQIKNGVIKNGYPTYGTWFATATTVLYTKEELKAHNMADDEIFEHEVIIDEDPHEHALNPLIRCTPDGYFKKGVAKDKSSEPFCFPRDGQQLKMDKTYFVTWYSRFFSDEVENVRVHLSYIKETIRQKGLRKRDLADPLDKRSALIEQGAKVDKTSFYQSDWVKKSQGWFPLTINEEWIGEKDYNRKVLISIQPDNVDESEFDYLQNSIVIEISKGVRVSREHNVDLAKLEQKYNDPNFELEEGIDEKYYVMLTMPTIVMVAALGMYLFVWYNQVDLSHLKKRTFARKAFKHKMVPLKGKYKDYGPLPQYNNDDTKHD
ncbi:uncharacterized protein RJT21DRAFT_123609 [Scheffersomyces amazonensis]|uniref:uncharacterized protein n=1 Tax=Scheffersomyces amazonensis TaxID=1078765 RepID=UPI00315D82DE